MNEFNTGESFIKGWTLDNLSICDELVEFFENSTYVKPGTVLKGAEPIIVKNHKDSLDLQLLFHETITQRYLEELAKVTDEYVKVYPACTMGAPWRVEAVNIQKYVPGAGFHNWHSERLSDSYPDRSRVLVYMTYLNDVDDGGETEWMHQGMKVKPRKGLTVIWPADWTHTHRGITSPTQTKYIITGWFQFFNYQAPPLNY
jgi:hypothetical protein